MAFSNELSVAIEELISECYESDTINKDAKKISKKYRANNNDGSRLVTKDSETIAYALSRMPATYEAVSSVLETVFENNQFEINSVADIGSGTGAATWAMYDKIGKKNYVCYERENEMINTGKKIMKKSDLNEFTEWKNFDIIQNEISDKYDLVISSYMINELEKNQIQEAVDKMLSSTKNVLIIIEPGTPRGFSNIRFIRQYLISQNCHIIAPCPHESDCKISDDDWCGFSCRVQRSRIHKNLKGGVAPYEDEKYSYIAVSKHDIKRAENRILRHPIINKGFSEFRLCTIAGIKDVKLSKRDGIVYKNAKKKSAGDSIDFTE